VTQRSYMISGLMNQCPLEFLCDLTQELCAPGKIGLVHTGFRVLIEIEERDFLSPSAEIT